ncbi:MAG: hypothetical protein MUD15_04960, partial [Desulfobacterota bacterium]|nr:hypothetical protein [Thermodesulfobacteriota bacterium]
MGKDSIVRIGTVCAILLTVSLVSGTATGDNGILQEDPKAPYGNDLKVLITQVAKSLIPAVVHIEVTQQQLVPYSGFPDLP